MSVEVMPERAVFKVVRWSNESQGEVVVCELGDGEEFRVELAGTNLASHVHGNTKEPCSWVELGMRDNRKLYMEALYTSEEFEALPRHAQHLDLMSYEKNEQWRELHRVPQAICPDGLDLYYGCRPMPIAYNYNW